MVLKYQQCKTKHDIVHLTRNFTYATINSGSFLLLQHKILD